MSSSTQPAGTTQAKKSKKMAKSKRSVRFGVVQIREYQRIAGDHPDAQEGPPLGISWKFAQKKDVKVATYDKRRAEAREKLVLPLNASTRQYMLSHVFNISQEKMKRAEKQARKVQNQRRETFLEWREGLDNDEEEEGNGFSSRLGPLPNSNAQVQARDDSECMDDSTGREESSTRGPSVTFSVVQVRDYQRIVGNHPDVPEGPPLGISWKFAQREDVPVSAHESTQERTGQELLPLNAQTRQFKLYHVFDVPQEKLLKAEKIARKVQKQRQESFLEWRRELKAEEPEEFNDFSTRFDPWPAATPVRPKPGKRRAASLNAVEDPKARKSFLISQPSARSRTASVNAIEKDSKLRISFLANLRQGTSSAEKENKMRVSLHSNSISESTASENASEKDGRPRVTFRPSVPDNALEKKDTKTKRSFFSSVRKGITRRIDPSKARSS